MEYIVFLVAAFFLLTIIFGTEWHRNRQNEKLFREKLVTDFGKRKEKEYKSERFEKIPTYYRKHEEENQIDDITWNDLNMDDLFRRMNTTLSSTGEEYLYYLLRSCNREEEDLIHLENIINYFSNHPKERVQVQLLMHQLGTTGKYSLYDYLDNLDTLGERTNWKEILLDLFYIPCLILIPFHFSLGLISLIALMLYHIISYYKEKGEIEPYAISFIYIMKLLKISEKLIKTDCSECREEFQHISEAKKELREMKIGFAFVSGMYNSSVTTGNPLDILMDYLKMIFHVDILAFNHIYHIVKGHISEIDCILSNVGYLESAIVISEFRESLHGEYALPVFCDGASVNIQEGYHPLLHNPVKNTINAGKGVLLTGSNASGKSTFLKMIATNVIMAQTIHTCTCAFYEAPLYRVFSSMSLRDSLENGDSYFIVEIKALKRILDASLEAEKRPVLGFVDEVLRGTNTVERIAASTCVIQNIIQNNCMLFAATHDIELTKLLEKDMTNYHFEEEVENGDVHFSYQLKQGPAKTRNAIKLLEVLGYDPELTKQCQELAKQFDVTGHWY